jgi:hypothetical protein
MFLSYRRREKSIENIELLLRLKLQQIIQTIIQDDKIHLIFLCHLSFMEN